MSREKSIVIGISTWYLKWAIPYRTSDLLLVSYVGAVLLRTVLLGKFAYLSGLRHFDLEANPAVFGSVLLRLQHGCSTLHGTATRLDLRVTSRELDVTQT